MRLEAALEFSRKMVEARKSKEVRRMKPKSANDEYLISIASAQMVLTNLNKKLKSTR